MRCAGAVLLALFAAPVLAQNGDRAGEEQPGLPPDLEVPAAPALSPEDELGTLRVHAGHRVELFAAEPLVVDPVQIAFDELGRLWVVEMRGYMPDAEGNGEK
ncbi:MAG: dehydrogenase, partial [Planctomycetota bacterium]